MSYQRKLVSRKPLKTWMPACAGMTILTKLPIFRGAFNCALPVFFISEGEEKWFRIYRRWFAMVLVVMHCDQKGVSPIESILQGWSREE